MGGSEEVGALSSHQNLQEPVREELVLISD